MCHSAPHCHTTLTLFCPGKALNWGQDLEKLGFTRSYFLCLLLTSCWMQATQGNCWKTVSGDLGAPLLSSACECFSPYLNMSLPALLKHCIAENTLQFPLQSMFKQTVIACMQACSYSPDALTRRPFAGLIRDKFNQP